MAPGAVKTLCLNHLIGLLCLHVSVGGPASSERANQILLSFDHSVLCPPTPRISTYGTAHIVA